MMKILVALLCLGAATAFAAGTPDYVGIVLDSESYGGWDLALQTTGPFQQITVYMVLTNPSLGGVSGWEACVDIDGPTVAWSWDVGLIGPEYLGPYFQIEYGVGSHALRPNSAGNVLLMSGTGFVMSPSDEVSITIKGLPGSRFVGDAPGYSHPDDLDIDQALRVPVGDYNLPCFIVNGGIPVDVSITSWSRIKATFGE